MTYIIISIVKTKTIRLSYKRLFTAWQLFVFSVCMKAESLRRGHEKQEYLTDNVVLFPPNNIVVFFCFMKLNEIPIEIICHRHYMFSSCNASIIFNVVLKFTSCCPCADVEKSNMTAVSELKFKI